MPPFDDDLSDTDSVHSDQGKTLIFDENNLPNPEENEDIRSSKSKNDSGVSTIIGNSESLNRFLNDVENNRNNEQVFDNFGQLIRRICISGENDNRRCGNQIKSFAYEFENLAYMVENHEKNRNKPKRREKIISSTSLPDNISSGARLEEPRAVISRGRISPEQYLSDRRIDSDRCYEKNHHHIPSLNFNDDHDFHKKEKPSGRNYIPSTSTRRSSTGSKNCYHTNIYKCPCIDKHHQPDYIRIPTTKKNYYEYNHNDIIRRLTQMKDDAHTLKRHNRRIQTRF